MLLQFNFSNYGPFKNETSLNLEATSYSEYKEQVRVIDGNKILPVNVIFGANGSGKSFVYRAFRYMRYIVCSSVNFDSNAEPDSESFFANPVSFRLDDESKMKPSSFEIVLNAVINGKSVMLQYGFSVLNHKIENEWLYQLPKSEKSNSKVLLYRDSDMIKIGISKMDSALKATLETSTSPQTLVLSLGAKLNVDIFKNIFDFFSLSRVDDFANLYEIIYYDHKIPSCIVENDKVKNECVSFLQTFEPSIKDLIIEEIMTEKNGTKKYRVNTVHVTSQGKEVIFKMEEESAGTQKMFLLFNDLYQIIKTGTFLFIDELNARLHPLLLRNIMLLFLDKDRNPNNAQLVFTCHEPWILRSRLLRRDEIYFTNKDNETGISSLYSLAEFTDENGSKIRQDEDFEKNYLLGKYDGIPSLDVIDFAKKGN